MRNMNQYEMLWLVSIRAGKSLESVTAAFEALAYEAGVPDDWKDPDSSYTLESVVQQIESYYGIELFRHKQDQD